MPHPEDEYPDVFRSLEAGIVGVFRADPELLDAHVDRALESLQRVYLAEIRGRAAPPLSLSPRAAPIYAAIRSLGDWWLGREVIVDAEGVAQAPSRQLDPATLVTCLKRLRQVAAQWTKQDGRQGYLTRLARFVA